MTIKTTSIASTAKTTGTMVCDSLLLPHLIVGEESPAWKHPLHFKNTVSRMSSLNDTQSLAVFGTCQIKNVDQPMRRAKRRLTQSAMRRVVGTLDNMHNIDTSDKLRGIYSSVKAVQATTNERIKNGNIKIKYNRSGIDYKNNDDGSVCVTRKDTRSGEQNVETFAGVHFRTGYSCPFMPGGL